MTWKIISRVEIPEGFTLCTPEDTCETCKHGVAPHQETHFFQNRPDGSQLVKTFRSLTTPPVDADESENDIENDYKTKEDERFDRMQDGYGTRVVGPIEETRL